MSAVESMLDQWEKQPGARVSPAERQFIADMRKAAAAGVGYGWMRQIASVEWSEMLQRDYGLAKAAADMGAGHVCPWCNTDSRTGKKAKRTPPSGDGK